MFEKATRGMSIYAKIAYGILLSMAALIPLAVGSCFVPFISTNNQFALFKMAGLLFLTSACLIFWALDFLLGSKSVRWHTLMWFVLAYLGSNVISFIFSIDKKISFMGDYDRLTGLVPTMVLVILFFLTLQLLRNNAGMEFLMKVFVLTSVVLACYGLLQYAGIDSARVASKASGAERRSSSFYGNSNLYAGYLCFSLFFSAGLLLVEKKLVWRITYWVAFLCNLAVVFTSMTRSVWLACIVALPLFALLAWRQKVKITKTDRITMGASALAGILFVVTTFSSKVADLNIAQRLSTMFSFEGSAGTRIETWKSAIQVAKEYPLFGGGPDTYVLTGMSHLTDRYLSLVGVGEIQSNAHCLPLHLCATIGIIGMLSYYIVAIYAFTVGFKYAWQNNSEKQSGPKIVYSAVLVSVVAFTINCLVSIADVGVLPFYWIALAYLVVPQTKEIQCEIQWLQVIPLVVAIPFALMCYVVPVKFIAADHCYRLGQDANQASNEQIVLYEKATELNPYESNYTIKLLDSIGGNYIARINSLSISEAQEFLAKVDDLYNKHPRQMNLESVSSYYYTAIAISFQNTALCQMAIDHNEAILKITPRQLKVLGDLASLYKAIGQTKKAEEIRRYLEKTGPDTVQKQDSLKLIDSVNTFQK